MLNIIPISLNFPRLILWPCMWFICFSDSSVGKESACNAGDPDSIPGLGWYFGEGKGYPLQYSGLQKSMDCIVPGVAKSRTQLNDFHSLMWFVLRVFHVHSKERVFCCFWMEHLSIKYIWLNVLISVSLLISVWIMSAHVSQVLNPLQLLCYCQFLSLHVILLSLYI